VVDAFAVLASPDVDGDGDISVGAAAVGATDAGVVEATVEVEVVRGVGAVRATADDPHAAHESTETRSATHRGSPRRTRS
jgi:hypothetical protein